VGQQICNHPCLNQRKVLLKFENTWFPLPFFLLNGKQSEFGPTNWCRFKLITTDINGKTRKYNLLLAFDTQSCFEDENFENEDLNETPVFTNVSEKSKQYAICNNEFKLTAFCSEAYNCDWVDKYVLKHFHNIENLFVKKVRYYTIKND
jgi:hypothetical protein